MDHIKKLYTEGANRIRFSREHGPDRKDLREFRAQKWADADFRAALTEANAKRAEMLAVGGPMRRVRGGSGAAYGSARGGVGAITYGGSGYAQASGGAPMDACSARSQIDPGCLRGASPECLDEIPCHADILGFTTLEDSNFPIAGVAAPALGTLTQLQISPETTNFYKPAFLFVEARDSTDAFSIFPGIITNVTINRVQQLSSSGYSGGVVTSAFSVETPLDVRKFATFGSNTNDQLVMEFGNFGGVGVDLHYFGIFWGDNVPCR